ncbi:MAG: ASCH domain-containing protein [Spirochaetales bacterium]|nr:ASCH domain-containing protein [Spirochaetales bacterium]
MQESVKDYWNHFIADEENRKRYAGRSWTAWHFCDNQQDADALAKLVTQGIKRGTASLVRSYEAEDEPLPQVGDISIITNWDGQPQCIIETVRLDRYRFKKVPASFAVMEGEGDKTLEYWKRAHREAFTREAEEFGFDFHEDLDVLCEEFTVIDICSPS